MASLVAYDGGGGGVVDDPDGESGEGENIHDGEGDGEGHRRRHSNPHNMHHRKRKKSLRESDANYLPPYKKNRFRRQVSVLPSKFLLGGNIRDPLNLASLADAKVNAELNKATPTNSPLDVPSNNNKNHHIPVFIPKYPDDPLGLAVPTDCPDDIIAGVRKKKRHRRRHGRKRTDSECSVASVGDEEDNDGEEGEGKEMGGVGGRAARRSVSEGEVFEPKPMPKPSGGGQQQGGQNKEVQVTRRQSITKKELSVVAEKKSSPPKVKEPEPKAAPKPVEVKPTVQETLERAAETLQKVVAAVASQAQPAEVKADVPGKDPKEVKEETVKGKEEVASSSVTQLGDTDKTPKINVNGEEPAQPPSERYPCKSSEYIPLSSSYAPSPYIFDTMNPEDGFEVKPFESPSLTNYYCNAVTPSHLMEPFSPPPRPEIPHFQKRMQMMSSHPPPPPHRPQHEMSLQRAVFQKPFYRRRFRHKSDPIVSPVIPQPGCNSRRNHHHHHNHNHRHNKKNNDKQGNSLNTSNTSANSNHSSGSKKGTSAKAKQADALSKNNEITNFRSKDEIYQFGNYKQYYGYRTPEGEDSRLWILKKDWFRGKDVLDIGCNIGHVTLSIARDFEAKRVHGIDIDNNLITTARKNIKHYMIHDPSDKTIVFPHSLPMIYGAMQPPSGVGITSQQFPFNVMFSQENYVFSNDAQLESVKPEYDVIMCLSVSKWIHLNFGDEGLKRFFRRMFRHLRDGGKLILEPQEWSSYYRKRKLTAKISENYKNITFLPDRFQDFLVRDVGFTFIQRLGTPHHSKGFQRPILIFGKESKGSSPVTEQNTADVASTSTATTVAD